MLMIRYIGLFLAAIWMPIILQILLKDSIDRKRLLIGNFINTLIWLFMGFFIANEIGVLIGGTLLVFVFIFVFKTSKIQLLYIPVAYVINVICNFAEEAFYIKLFGKGLTDEMNTVDDLVQAWLITILIILVSFAFLMIKRKIQNNNTELWQNKEVSFLLIASCIIQSVESK